MGTALYSGLPGTLSSSFWQKKIIVMAKKKTTTLYSDLPDIRLSLWLSSLITLFCMRSISRSLETYYSVKRGLLQCQNRPTTV